MRLIYRTQRMSDTKAIPNDVFPEFGHFQYEGISLEINVDGRWESFQPFYFDEMLNKE